MNDATRDPGPSDARGLFQELLRHRLDQPHHRAFRDSLGEREREGLDALLDDLASRSTIAEELAHASSIPEVLGRLTSLIARLLDAETATIFLYDPDSDELFTLASADDRMTRIRFPANKGVAGHVLRTGESLHIKDAYSDPRFNAQVDQETGHRTRGILAVPIVRETEGGGETIGVVEALDRRDGEFEDRDLQLLQALVRNAAAPVVAAQLQEQIDRVREEEQKLFAVTAAISTELQLLPLLKRIMETVGELLDADRATLFMHDPRTKELWTAVSRDESMQRIRFPDSKGIAGAVFTTGDTINIPDAHEDPRFNPEFDRKTGYRTRSILCMPVVSRKGPRIAVTQVLNKKGGPFSRADERRLRAFSSQAAIAIENAQLFDEVVRIRNYNESILQSMTNAVIAIDRDGAIEKLNRAAASLLGVDAAAKEIIGRPAAEVFAGRNAWLVDTVAKVTASGRPEIAVDAALGLPDKREAAVNLTAVPLTDAKDQPIGCLLLLEDLTREKRLRNTMARYMTKDLADRLLDEGEVALGGKMQRAAVLFSDIRSFTTISERLGAQQTVRMLNDYFGIMVDIILDQGGILDKYIGDAIMAVFGVPFTGERDSDNALSAAIGMLRALGPFNEGRRAAGEEPVLIGIGINTDEIVSGNIGSIKRMDYTVIGDGVNLASRLEGANKPYGTQILLSEFTLRDLKDTYRLREVDRIRVKGKARPVAVYEALDWILEAEVPRVDELLGCFNRALGRYRDRDWPGAIRELDKALAAAPEDGPARLYRERCLYFAEHPPAKDWDGVWIMKDK